MIHTEGNTDFAFFSTFCLSFCTIPYFFLLVEAKELTAKIATAN
jgi:hypothetical protein